MFAIAAATITREEFVMTGQVDQLIGDRVDQLMMVLEALVMLDLEDLGIQILAVHHTQAPAALYITAQVALLMMDPVGRAIQDLEDLHMTDLEARVILDQVVMADDVRAFA
jgi:hypothetical protein